MGAIRHVSDVRQCCVVKLYGEKDFYWHCHWGGLLSQIGAGDNLYILPGYGKDLLLIFVQLRLMFCNIFYILCVKFVVVAILHFTCLLVVTYISCFNLLQVRGQYCGLWWSEHYGQVSMERGNWNSIKREKLYLPLPLHKPYPSNNNRLTLSAPYLVQHIWSYVHYMYAGWK